MRPSQRSGSRLAATIVVGLGLGLGLGLGGCGQGNPGIDPPADQLGFPSGLLLDPRVSVAPTGPCDSDADCSGGQQCGAGQCREVARWLLVTNANSDRRYNAGSLLAIDLDAFWAAAFEQPQTVLDAGAKVDRDKPCRRIANRPQAVECVEQPFVRAEATVHFGTFPGPTVAWDEDPADDEAMLLVPVRGDPSITMVTLSGGLGGDDLQFACGQDSEALDGRRCGDDNRLRFLRNDPEAERLAREPFRIHISPQPELPLAYITHQGDADMSLLALKGLEVGGDGRPAIVDQSNVFGVTSGYQGGFGITSRPCNVDAAPVSTLGCTRPLVYGSMRWQEPLAVQVFTAVDLEPLPGSEQRCVGPDELDLSGAIICEHQAKNLTRFGAGGLSTAAVSPVLPRLADLAFANDGDELYVLQVNPGALIRVDTSLGVDGDPINSPVAAVEVCAQPTTMKIYADGENSYALVTCYRSAELFIVDLTSLTVAGLARAGIGPDQIEVDYAREVIYVANTLDATVSVVDMARQSPTRFTEIGHIGLSQPYTQ